MSSPIISLVIGMDSNYIPAILNLRIVSLLGDSSKDKQFNVKPPITTLMGGFFVSIQNVDSNTNTEKQDNNKEKALELIDQWLQELEKEIGRDEVIE